MGLIPTYSVKKHKCKFEGCGSEFVKFNGLQKYCRKHEIQVKLDKRIAKAKKVNPKPLKKVTPIRKGYRVTGELKLFMEIWSERKQISEISGKPLLPPSSPFFVNQFLHILPKGKFPEMRLNKENIMLATHLEHDKQDTFKVFQDRKEKLLNQIYNKK